MAAFVNRLTGTFYGQNGNAFGATAVLGTTDNNALDLRVNGARAMRLQPTGGSPNVIGGHANNAAVPSYEGQTIAGGGTAGANCFDPPTGTTTRSCANLTNSLYATVSGGYANQANSFWSAVGGGTGNTAGGNLSVVGGGAYNIASGLYSTVVGGNQNTASGDGSLAAGTRARTQTAGGTPTIHHGAFAWADSGGFDFNTQASNEFAARATGGVRFVTAIDGSGNPTRTLKINPNGELDFGAQTRQMLNLWGPAEYGIGIQASTLYFRTNPGSIGTTGGFSWFRGGSHNDGSNNAGGGVEMMRLASNHTLYVTGGSVGVLSDRASKQGFTAVDASDVLARVAQLPLTTWSYKVNPSVRHIGPTSQDFREAFEVGDDDARSISMIDADGVALAAIQGLNAKVEAQAREIAELKQQHAAQIAELRRAVQAVLAHQPAETTVAAAR